jgi:hypothetical protein
MTQARDIRHIVDCFQLLGDFRGAAPYGSGHINDTYCAVFTQGGTTVRYILQRLNAHVFKEPAKLMENVDRVVKHIGGKLGGGGGLPPSRPAREVGEKSEGGDISRRVLTLIPTREGRYWHVDEEGGYWRCYIFIEGATSHDRVQTAEQAFAAAQAFGRFQRQLADLPGPPLHETIPFFHHTRSRFNALRHAADVDRVNRAGSARWEIEFCAVREAMTDVLLNLQAKGELPERVTHNDTKLNNVLLDDVSGEGVCVIDLDTVMPGVVLSDFGDLCRTAACTTLEDEADLSRVEVQLEMFSAIAHGYLGATAGWLLPAEREQLVFSARLITFEVGVRFLTDYLEGDVYFKTRYPQHNLQRARTQFALVRSFERNEEGMRRIVESGVDGVGMLPAELKSS